MLDLLTRTKLQTVIIYHDDLSVTLDDRTLRCKVKRHDVDVLSLDVFPDIGLGPVGNREDTDALTLVDLRVIKLPHLRALVLRVPCMVLVTEGEDSLLRTRLLLVASSATECSGKSVFV